MSQQRKEVIVMSYKRSEVNVDNIRWKEGLIFCFYISG